MDGWAARDVTAHLIGWNLYTIKGCQQLKKGETPFYLIDPGDDFCKVNALLVKNYDSKNKKKLINRLKASAEELKNYLTNINPSDWENDFEVIYNREPVMIKNSVDELIHDYINHRQQIEKWAEKTNTPEK